jgi:hypothetical protein
MIAGHFGVAVGVKARAPRVPLWALLLATFWLDVIFFFILAPLGVEYITQTCPSHACVTVHGYYTHSLLGALLIAVVTGLLASLLWSRRGGMVIGAVVFSHWLLDLLVHQPDLPILPNNLGNLPLLGFGLWQVPAVTVLVELVLILGGAYLYYRRADQLPVAAGRSRTDQQRRVYLVSSVTTVLLLAVLATDWLGL